MNNIGRIAVVGIVLLSSGCKPKSGGSTTPPSSGNPTSDFVPYGTGQHLTLIDDTSSGGGAVSSTWEHNLAQLPPQLLAGVQTLHFSNFVNEIGASLYNTYQAAWNSISNLSGSAAADDFMNWYKKWLGRGQNFNFNDFSDSALSGNTVDAAKYLFITSLFYNRQDKHIYGYNGSGNVSTPSFQIRDVPFAVAGNVLTLFSSDMITQTVNGVLSIVKFNGVAVKPIPIPQVFIENIMINGGGYHGIMPTTSVKSSEAVSAGPFSEVTTGTQIIDASVGDVFVSPNTPDMYQAVTNSIVASELDKEMSDLSADLKALLKQSPGALPHGLHATSQVRN